MCSAVRFRIMCNLEIFIFSLMSVELIMIHKAAG